MAQPGRNIAPLVKQEESDEEKKRRQHGGRDVTSLLKVSPSKPAQTDNPGARTGQVLRESQQFIGDTYNREAALLDQDLRGRSNDEFVQRTPGRPTVGSVNEPNFQNYDPDATALDYVDTSNTGVQRAIVAQRGATFGAGDELIGALGGPDARQVTNEFYNRAYEERPLESMGIEALGSIPTGVVGARAVGAAGGGLRTAGTLEGGTYLFNEPMTKGDGLGNRSINAVGGAAGGRILGGVGQGSVNVGQRLNNRLSGNQTIQSVAQDDFGITLTEGQIKQDVGLQGFERDARKGSKGQDAAEVAIQSFKDQERATVDAGRGLGGNRFATSNEAAGDFLSGVQGRVQTQQDAINQAYERARGFNANLNAEGAESMPQAVVSGLDSDLLQELEINPRGFRQTFPNTSAALDSIKLLSQAGLERGGLPFQQLENTRKRINKAISASTQNPEDRRAALQLKGSFDKFIDTAVDQALFDADDQFITAYREARGLRAQFAEDWEANKVFKKLIETDATPEMAINFVLGGGKLAGDNQMVVLRQLKTALADDPETIAALQEAYMKKFMRQTEKTFNPKVLRDSLDELLVGKNQSFASELLDPDQYQQLRKFRSVVDSLIPMDGTVNTSNTGAAIERTRGAVSDFLTGPLQSGPVRMTGRVINELLGKYVVRTGGARARQQFNPAQGLDTRRIESGFPVGSPVPEGQLPGGTPQAALDSPDASDSTGPRSALDTASDAAAAGIVAAPLATGVAEAQSNQQLFEAEPGAVEAARFEVQEAQERLTYVQDEVVGRIESDLMMLDDVNADAKDLQKILKRRIDPNLTIDGVIGPETQGAINRLREQLKAELEPARQEAETARAAVSDAQARLTQAEQRSIYAKHSDAGGIGDVLKAQASNIGAGLGIMAGLGSRWLNLRGARKKVGALEDRVNDQINTKPIAPTSVTGPNSVHERAANMNEVWRLGGAGENVPFKQNKGGQWVPRPNAVEPSNLYKQKGALESHFDVSDAGWIGGGLFEAHMATQYLEGAKQDLLDAQQRVAAAEESGNLAAYEKALQDLQQAETMVQIFTGAQRVGMGLAGMHGLGVLKSKYPSARPNIGAAEKEVGLVRRGIASRRR